MTALSTNICGIEFKNPVIAASGTFNFGKEFKNFFSLSKLGGICLKGLTLGKREGNDSPRIAECYGGILNSVGLQNPGLEAFLRDLTSVLKEDTNFIANIAGNTVSEYCALAERLSDTDISMIELNISCPNVKKGGLSFGVLPEDVKNIVKEVRKFCKKPLIVKLSPNVASISDNALAAQDGGADCISLINTLKGMAIDIYTRKPILSNVIGGLSGPAIKPVALAMVYECYKAVDIPIIGIGGIMDYKDALEFMLAGASAVQVGTANMINPMAMVEIIEELTEFCKENNIKNIKELVGGLVV
ncbi:MAG: dihydroorotate dehydrogenase [Bacillota bacterium]|jgi:dihydroorotate dehydrogenase (NAD+) catalytic subunit|nr:dihydroorotate dehydrogenase [Bacillota bacterium]HHU42819.1 dihydroorotate dehydrogenase [Clostridiales bacterium]